jgi:putative PIN family toxin of toxin-antitoxin system
LAIKVVIDTNIYISAIFWGGKPRAVIDLGRDKKIQIFTSPDIENEISEKLRVKFNLPESEVNQILFDFSTFTFPIIVKKKYQVVSKDPDDDKFIECAMQCHADFIVTGDHHLLDIREYSGIKILSASEFLNTEFPGGFSEEE